MKSVHLVLRPCALGRYVAGYEVVAAYSTRKAANAEAKRRNQSPYTRNRFEVKSKQIIEG